MTGSNLTKGPSWDLLKFNPTPVSCAWPCFPGWFQPLASWGRDTEAGSFLGDTGLPGSLAASDASTQPVLFLSPILSARLAYGLPFSLTQTVLPIKPLLVYLCPSSYVLKDQDWHNTLCLVLKVNCLPTLKEVHLHTLKECGSKLVSCWKCLTLPLGFGL